MSKLNSVLNLLCEFIGGVLAVCMGKVPAWRWSDGTINHEPEPMAPERAARVLVKFLTETIRACPQSKLMACEHSVGKCKDHWCKYIKDTYGIDVEDDS